MISAPHRKAWLDWLSIEKRYGDNTLSAYGLIWMISVLSLEILVPLPSPLCDEPMEFRAWLADMAARGLREQLCPPRLITSQLLSLLWQTGSTRR